MKLRYLLVSAFTLAVTLLVAVTLLTGRSSSTNKATGARQTKPVWLTLANPSIGADQVGDWKQAVERLSHGSLRIRLLSNYRTKQVYAERGTLADLRKGQVDVAKIPTRAWDTLGVNSFQPLQAPFLVDSLELERQVLGGPLGAEMLAGVSAAGVEPLGVLPGPLRRPLGVTRDLLGPGDYRGALVGSRPSAVATATARALGARYRDVALGASIAGLDAFDDNLDGIDSARYDRHARSVTTDVALWPRAATLVMNRHSWRQLTPAQQDVLKRAARAAVAPMMKDLRAFDRGGVQVLCEQRFPMKHAGTAGIRALRRAVAPVYRQLEADPGTRRAIERIRELKAHTPPERPATCRSTNAPTHVSSLLVGSWHAHATRALIAKAPRASDESVEGNYGDVTLVLGSDGRFEFRNSRFPGHPMGLGSWSTVRGKVLVFRAQGTVDQGAAQTWRYRWWLFHGSLALKKLSRVAPAALYVAPFRRG